jgi:hypothetical protein
MSKYIKTSFNQYIFESNSNVKFPEFWYHGTNILFNKFTLDNVGKNYSQSILGIYFSQYLKPPIYGSTAKEYAENAVICNGGKPYIYKCKISMDNPLILDSSGWYSSNTFIDKNRYEINRLMEQDNHDCIIVYDFDNYKEEGLEWGDFILVTNKIENIKIVESFVYNDNIK